MLGQTRQVGDWPLFRLELGIRVDRIITQPLLEDSFGHFGLDAHIFVVADVADAVPLDIPSGALCLAVTVLPPMLLIVRIERVEGRLARSCSVRVDRRKQLVIRYLAGTVRVEHFPQRVDLIRVGHAERAHGPSELFDVDCEGMVLVPLIECVDDALRLVQQHLLDTLTHLDGAQAGNLPSQMQSDAISVNQHSSAFIVA